MIRRQAWCGIDLRESPTFPGGKSRETTKNLEKTAALEGRGLFLCNRSRKDYWVTDFR